MSLKYCKSLRCTLLALYAVTRIARYFCSKNMDERYKILEPYFSVYGEFLMKTCLMMYYPGNLEQIYMFMGMWNENR